MPFEEALGSSIAASLERRRLNSAAEDTKSSGVVLREDGKGGGKEGSKSKSDDGKCKLHGGLGELGYEGAEDDGLKGRVCIFVEIDRTVPVFDFLQDS